MALKVSSLKDKHDNLVLRGQDVAVLAAPYGTTLPTSITSDAQGNLAPLPAGWKSVGEIEEAAGLTITPDVQTGNLRGYGSRGDRRVWITQESVTIGFTAQESTALNLEMFWDVSFEGGIDPSTGEQMVKKSYAGAMKYWSLLAIAEDENEDGIILPYWLFPKVTVTKKDAVKLDVEGGIVYPFEFTAFEDPDFAGYMGIGHAGAGFAQIALDGGFDAT